MRNAASALVTRWSTRLPGQPKGHARRARRVPGKKPHPRGRGRFGQHRNGWVLPHRALEPGIGFKWRGWLKILSVRLNSFPWMKGRDRRQEHQGPRRTVLSGERRAIRGKYFRPAPRTQLRHWCDHTLCRGQSNADSRRQMDYLWFTAKGRDIAVVLNGNKTAELRNGMFDEGRIALQHRAEF